MPEAVRGARRIHYTVSGSGRAVVLIPGIGAGARLFGTLPRRFARAGFRCIAFDPVGVPPSSTHVGEYDIAEAGQDVLAVLDDIELDQCGLIGLSFGGKVGLATAVAAPARIRSLAMLAASAVTTARGRRIDRMFEILVERLEPEELGEVFAAFLFGDGFQSRHRRAVDDIVRSMEFAPATRALIIAQARCLPGFDGAALARAVTCPCLCLAGSEDTLTSPAAVAATAAMMPDATFEEIPGAGHSLFLEAASVFDRVTAFLETA